LFATLKTASQNKSPLCAFFRLNVNAKEREKERERERERDSDRERNTYKTMSVTVSIYIPVHMFRVAIKTINRCLITYVDSKKHRNPLSYLKVLSFTWTMKSCHAISRDQIRRFF
jgi:hypothetical protein